MKELASQARAGDQSLEQNLWSMTGDFGLDPKVVKGFWLGPESCQGILAWTLKLPRDFGLDPKVVKGFGLDPKLVKGFWVGP